MLEKSKLICECVSVGTCLGFDLDGTVLSMGQWKAHIKELINRLASKYFVFFATGRSIFECRSILCGLNVNIPLICDDGQYIYNLKENRYLQDEYIKMSDNDIVYFQLNKIETAVECAGHVYTESRLLKKLLKTYCGLDDSIILYGVPEEQEKLYKIYFCEKKQGSINKMVKNYSITKIDGRFGSLTDRNVNKYTAFKKLAKSISRKEADTLYFGDGVNDLEMFAAVKTGVAVCNAVPELREISKYNLESEQEFVQVLSDLCKC